MDEERDCVKNWQWARIESLLPGKESDPGRTAADNRLFVEAVLFVGRTAIPWRDLPPRYGSWNSVYKRFARWCKAGVWAAIFEELAQDSNFDLVALDSTIIRVHHHATGAQKKQVIRLLGGLVGDSRPKYTHWRKPPGEWSTSA